MCPATLKRRGLTELIKLKLEKRVLSASIEAYKGSFFPQTIRDRNDLPDSLFSTAEMSDDCVSKFASLVRSRD